MKRITSVELVNFQSHAHSVVNFDDGFNAIVGESGHGKTAIFRALRWALYNEPSGTNFIKRGKTGCQVIVKFNDGTIIDRIRNGKTNAYKITYPDGNEKILEGFGTKAPMEVTLAHGMRTVPLANSRESLNLSKQLDGPFLLSESPGVRATLIGRMAHTEIIDRSMKNTSSDILSTQQEAKKVKADIAYINNEIDKFGNLDSIKVNIDELESIIREIEQKSDKLEKARQLTFKLKQEMIRKQNIENILNTNSVFFDILEIADELLNKLKKYGDINVLNNKLLTNLERLDSIKSILNRYCNCVELADEVKGLEEKIRNYQSISNKMELLNKKIQESINLQKILEQYKDMDDIINLAEECQQRLIDYSRINAVKDRLDNESKRKEKGEAILKNLRSSLDEAIVNYQVALKEFKKCPVCFSDVDDVLIGKISNNLF